ncbi:thioesterase family protein [Pseudonocardia sp. KRD291]|uniref:thioesterase family protein n=1 Tax=Pseudonocardia sp. KRD291 TaxID=2792007 RepID=UPI001C4A4B50|nr:thioesterase family protein [Pseudonocardia sp. KRD291]MBW0105181.1 thioesterase family protein [Pseudonocardia sp. KRD291]
MPETTRPAAELVHRDTVRPEWIDYNGHLSEPYYVLVFGDATTALMDRVGMGPGYRAESGCSLYTLEAHVRYLREVGPDAVLEVRSRVLERDVKRARLWHELHVDGRVRATEELMTMHVGPDGATPFPEAVGAALDDLTGPVPDEAGRAIRSVVRRQPS